MSLPKNAFVEIILLAVIASSCAICTKKMFDQSSFVCTCTKLNCDTIGQIPRPKNGTYLMYSSNKDSHRFNPTKGRIFNGIVDVHEHNFLNGALPIATISIDRTKKQQEMLGFGGAFTDATGINIAKLPKSLQDQIIKSYFDNDGLGYNFGRVPMGSTDFSVSGYSYDDTINPDPELTQFSLQTIDYNFKIPYIKQAKQVNPNVHLFTSTWTAPKWMKTNGLYIGGRIKDKYYQTWADYFIKFLEEYQKAGINFWGITTGNEPSLAFVNSSINSNAWTGQQLKKWVGENLGPAIRNSSFKDLKILTLDDQRFFLPWYPEIVLEGNDQYIDGIAVHWYWDAIVPAQLLALTHQMFPNKMLINTESCRGDRDWEVAVALGDWSRAEDYAHGFIEDFNNYVQGWVDWNLVLNTEGGPSYIKNYVDAPIIVNEKEKEFYMQPMYYAIGHFSKFIPRGTHKVPHVSTNTTVETAAFLRKDGCVVVVLMNRQESSQEVVITDVQRGHINLKLTPKSINSLLYL